SWPTSVADDNGKPLRFRLSQNYPNPFNPATDIQFSIGSPPAENSQFAMGERQQVSVSIFDILGREVATLLKQDLRPGVYHVAWDAGNYPAGVYFCRLSTQHETMTNKMILVK